MAEKRFLTVPGVRIDAGGEDSPIPERVADGTAHFNAGLPGIDKDVGTRPDGKRALEYRPITNHELGSNRNIKEYAKRHGLEPLDGGRYRSLRS
jgi:hypothetical protein